MGISPPVGRLGRGGRQRWATGEPGCAPVPTPTPQANTPNRPQEPGRPLPPTGSWSLSHELLPETKELGALPAMPDPLPGSAQAFVLAGSPSALRISASWGPASRKGTQHPGRPTPSPEGARLGEGQPARTWGLPVACTPIFSVRKHTWKGCQVFGAGITAQLSGRGPERWGAA